MPSSHKFKIKLLFFITFSANSNFFSIILFVFLMPAVSYKVTGKPFKSIFCCITSLVVPGMSLTIDVFNFVSVFIKLLFPALGLPIIATENPSLIKEDKFCRI